VKCVIYRWLECNIQKNCEQLFSWTRKFWENSYKNSVVWNSLGNHSRDLHNGRQTRRHCNSTVHKYMSYKIIFSQAHVTLHMRIIHVQNIYIYKTMQTRFRETFYPYLSLQKNSLYADVSHKRFYGHMRHVLKKHVCILECQTMAIVVGA
jgi:hypothetical protein